MEKSLLQGLFCRYIPYQACLIPLLCLGMFQVISWDKEALEKWQHVVWGKKNKSIPSTLGDQQFRIWKSPRELSVFFFFPYLHPQRWNISARKIQSFGNFIHLYFRELFSPLREQYTMEDCIKEQFLPICNVSILQMAGFPKYMTECLFPLIRWKASAEPKKQSHLEC